HTLGCCSPSTKLAFQIDMTNLLHNFEHAYPEPACPTVCMATYRTAAGGVLTFRRGPDYFSYRYLLPVKGICGYGEDHDHQCIGYDAAHPTGQICAPSAHRAGREGPAILFAKKRLDHP